MAPSLLKVMLAVAFATIAVGEESEEDVMEWLTVEEPAKPFTPLVQLDDVSLQAFVRENDAVLVEFYAPWCGTCKMVGPEYEKAAWLAHNRSMPFKVAQLNADKYTDTADALLINKYPSVFLYRNGVPEKFPVLSVAEAYVAGASRILGAPNAESLSPMKRWAPGADVTDVAGWLFWRGATGGAISTSIVLYLPPGLSGPSAAAAASLTSAVETASRSLLTDPNLRFAVINDPDVLAAFEVDQTKATLVMYKEHDEGRVEYEVPASGSVDPAAVEAWVRLHQVPMVTVITHKNLAAYRQKVSHMALFFVGEQGAMHKATTARLQASLFTIAQSLEASGVLQRGNFTVGIVDGKKYGSWMGAYGLKEGEFPAMGLEDTATEALWALGDITQEGACFPPPDAARAHPPIGSPEFDALPDGYDVTAPFSELDGRPAHTAPWCPGGGSWKVNRAERAARLAQIKTAPAAVAVDTDGAVKPVTVPTFEEGFSHDETTVARKLAEDARLAEAGGAGEGLPPIPDDALYPPLFWTDVPVDTVSGWLKSVLTGGVPPTVPAKVKAKDAGNMYAAMAQQQGRAAVHTEESLEGSNRVLPKSASA